MAREQKRIVNLRMQAGLLERLRAESARTHKTMTRLIEEALIASLAVKSDRVWRRPAL